MAETQSNTGSELIYELDEKPNAVETFFLGFQHMLAMFAGVVTPPLIVAGVVGFGPAETAFFISMALVASGVTSYVQSRRVGPIGVGLLSVMGTSFAFVPMAIQAGNIGGIQLVLGMALAASTVEIVLSRFMKAAREIFTPIVTGTVVTLIGLSLAEVGITDFAGGQAALDAGAGNFGSMQNLGLGLFVLVTVIICNQFGSGLIKIASIAVGLIAGYIVAAFMGIIDFSPVFEAAWFRIPVPFKYGLDFKWSLFLPWAIVYCIGAIESSGNFTAIAEISGKSIKGDEHMDRLSRGVLCDAVGSAFAAVINSLPNSTFAQNIGVIRMSKVGSRVVGMTAGVILLVMGLVPKIGALVTVMPKSVLGGATLALFGMVATSGIKIAASEGFNDRNLFILSIALAAGIGVEMQPEVVDQLPEIAKNVLHSGVATGAIVAIILNLVLPANESDNDKEEATA
ncbi:MAG: uracil-xanthine permease family protein [Bacillota bacterium]